MIRYLFVITALFVFSYAATAAPDLYLTNQDGIKTTQFTRTDSVYIEGFCPVASSSKEGVRFYIARDKTWSDGDKLVDVSAGIESLSVSSDVIPRTLIWRYPLNDGAYDVVIDVNNDYVLQSYENCIIGAFNTGFLVGNVLPPPPPPILSTPPATPTLTPPAPVPSPQSSTSLESPQSFSLGDSVEVKNFANVRKSAGGLQLGQQYAKSYGSIIGGPVKAAIDGKNFWFWNVNFEIDPDGWVADQTLAKTIAKPVDEPKILEPIVEGTTTQPEVVVATIKTEPTQDQKPGEEKLAQISSGASSGMNSFMGAGIIGLAIFLGLIMGSYIISRAIRKN